MKHTVESLTTKLREFTSGQLDRNPEDISVETPFADLGIDSHALLESIFFLEKDCGIIIPDSELTSENLSSIQSLALCAFRIQEVTGNP